jgi:hypothetical protein
MFYSQDKQDEYLETHIFKGYKNGFFIGSTFTPVQLVLSSK